MIKITGARKSSSAAIIRNLSDIPRSGSVLLGIPSRKSTRKKEPINNAELLWIHTHGSPARNIPSRPVLEPAVENNREKLTPFIVAADKAFLNGDASLRDQQLELLALTAQSVARGWFVDPRNGWAPNKPATIARKKSDLPLIDTAIMRNSITAFSDVKTNPVPVRTKERKV